MNAAARAVITDARQALSRTVAEAVERDLLVAAFVAWLRLTDVAKPPMAATASHAANVIGAARSYRDVAVLGFALTEPELLTKHAPDFQNRLEWLMGRPLLLGGDPTPLLTDAVAILGITLGGRACLSATSRANFETWLQRVHSESNKTLEGGWPGFLVAFLFGRAGSPDWVPAGLAGRWESAIPPKPDLTKIIDQAVTGAGEVATATEAALRLAALRWASERALEINLGAVAVADVALVLERAGTVFSRWVWEEKARNKGKTPRRWHVENEYHFQSLLFITLKPWLPELEEEQYLASTGPLQPRADLCLMSLALLLEVKFWYRRDSASRIIEEVAADVTLYLKSKAPYTSLIVAIWDDGARTEEHDALKRGLRDLEGVCGVVVVNRPSWMTPEP